MKNSSDAESDVDESKSLHGNNSPIMEYVYVAVFLYCVLKSIISSSSSLKSIS